MRAAFTTLASAAGVGIVLYLLAWGLGTDAAGAEETADAGPREDRGRKLVALGLMFLGALLLLRGIGLWLGDSVVWPVALVSFGLAVAATTAPGGLVRLASPKDLGLGTTTGRLVIGSVLMVAGLAVVLSSLQTAAALENAVFAVILTAAGFALVFGPWVYQLAHELAAERAERIRSEQHADFAAHLHDSVLQTLALIQRADEPRRMATLARAQERELRAWLYGAETVDDVDRLGTAIRNVAAKVERHHNLPVEVVLVGDIPLDDRTRALVAAAGEAMTNAALHSGADRVSVYVEAKRGTVEAWISDQGKSFDPAAVEPDRRGIADSIVGRMERHSGIASIVSDAEDGTEVHLRMVGL